MEAVCAHKRPVHPLCGTTECETLSYKHYFHYKFLKLYQFLMRLEFLVMFRYLEALP